MSNLDKPAPFSANPAHGGCTHPLEPGQEKDLVFRASLPAGEPEVARRMFREKGRRQLTDTLARVVLSGDLYSVRMVEHEEVCPFGMSPSPSRPWDYSPRDPWWNYTARLELGRAQHRRLEFAEMPDISRFVMRPAPDIVREAAVELKRRVIRWFRKKVGR